MTTIKVRKNGPYRVIADGDGDDVTIIDWNGREYRAPDRPIALCRCGVSATKPFCDKSHARAGFTPDEDTDDAGGGPAAG
jgi:CDGSH-type Zn-finger protein|tara:strand:- start:2328 stop:2567 length:240 start_codon:yes stop_codon:yes gene_type:complete